MRDFRLCCFQLGFTEHKSRGSAAAGREGALLGKYRGVSSQQNSTSSLREGEQRGKGRGEGSEHNSNKALEKGKKNWTQKPGAKREEKQLQ